ncbi:hypothetical protein PInf_017146 [Phytophthora infestans]|nr:hypothetical protein PInf_017146 [Phytophthora infestans]
MEDSDCSQDDLLGYGATASIQLGQGEPSPAPEEVEEAQHPHASEDEGLICEKVVELEQRSRLTASSDKALLTEVLATPPFGAKRKEVTEGGKKFAAQKKQNESASGLSEVHTDNDDILEQLLQLKEATAAQNQNKKQEAASMAQELETDGQ